MLLVRSVTLISDSPHLVLLLQECLGYFPDGWNQSDAVTHHDDNYDVDADFRDESLALTYQLLENLKYVKPQYFSKYVLWQDADYSIEYLKTLI